LKAQQRVIANKPKKEIKWGHNNTQPKRKQKKGKRQIKSTWGKKERNSVMVDLNLLNVNNDIKQKRQVSSDLMRNQNLIYSAYSKPIFSIKVQIA